MNNILLIILAIAVVILFYLKLFTDRTYVVTLQQDTKTIKNMVVKARTKTKAYEISSRYLWTHSLNYVITGVSNTIYFDKNSVIIIN